MVDYVAVAITENEAYSTLAGFFDKPVCQLGTSPLSRSASINLYVETWGPFCLSRSQGGTQLTKIAAEQPDITVRVPWETLRELQSSQFENVGELGIAILKAMADPNVSKRIGTELHIGLVTFIRRGYLGILPLGGIQVMHYLASKGLTNLGKIREAIASKKKERPR